MMKFNLNLIRNTLTAVVGSLFVAVPAFATTYTGGGFTVSINEAKGNLSYMGCDAKERCVYIPFVSSYNRGDYLWERKNYSYRMIPEGTNGQYRLKVINPKNKVILSQVMTPMEKANPNYVKDLINNSYCSFIVTNRVNSNVNIRAGAGLKNDVILQLKRGDGVRAVSRRGDWVKIVALFDGFPPNETYTPFVGWVNNRYINGCSEDQFEMWR
ncbi:MAG: SH3 domain-containing protein [Microcoleaceae cyanobacterium]